jgi:hypothetical protein
MTSKQWGGQRNPKSGAFGKVLVKSPIPNILGEPEAPIISLDGPQGSFICTLDKVINIVPDIALTNAWVVGMASILNVNLDAIATDVICDMSVEKNKDSPGMHLTRGSFTWRAYFLALIDGQDLIAEWAKTAFQFGGKPEDAGIGQLDDKTLGHVSVIEEHRQTSGITSKNYLAAARYWAKTGTVPYGENPVAGLGDSGAPRDGRDEKRAAPLHAVDSSTTGGSSSTTATRTRTRLGTSPSVRRGATSGSPTSASVSCVFLLFRVDQYLTSGLSHRESTPSYGRVAHIGR